MMSYLRPRGKNFIGLVIEAKGDTRMRLGDSISWFQLHNKDKIYSQAYLFTGKDSSATYAFLDESTIHLGENSLIFLDFLIDSSFYEEKKKISSNGIAVDLVEGSMHFNLKDDSPVKKIKIDDTLIDVSDQSTVIHLNHDKSGMAISVMKGDINILNKKSSYKVKQGEMLDIKNEQVDPTIKPVNQELMEEMKKIALEDHKRLMQELAEKRSLLSILNDIRLWIGDFFGQLSQG